MKTAISKSCAVHSHASSHFAKKNSFFQYGHSEPQSFFVPSAVQPKLKIGEPNDKFEKQADRVADTVVQSSDNRNSVQREVSQSDEVDQTLMMAEEEEAQTFHEEEEIQMKSENILQRKCAACEEESVQKKATDSANSIQSSNDSMSSQLQSNKGSGNKLPQTIETEMSQKMSADFSGVNIHIDSKAAEMNQSLGARAFTHRNDIYFNSGEYRPQTSKGKHLLAHELTHVVQQNIGKSKSHDFLQRDLVLPPQGSGNERGLSQSDIRNAVDFNERKYTDPYSYKTIRDVIGIPQYPAVSDEAMALGVAIWQADHGIAQDGKVGVVTLLTILEELEAEGQGREAQLLRADFQGVRANLLDVTSSHCGCVKGLKSDIQESLDFIKVYQKCGVDPSVTDGDSVEKCVKKDYASRGISLSEAGSTDSSGSIRVASQPGTCGPLFEMATRAHEQVHSVHTRELRQRHGSGRAYDRAYDDPKDWVNDEVNSRNTDIAVAKYLINVLNNLCSVNP